MEDNILFRLLCLKRYLAHVVRVDIKMSEIEELSQFLTLETRLDVKALALQQTLGIY